MSRNKEAKMAGRKRSISSPFFIGNCKVEIKGGSVACESRGKDFFLSTSDNAMIRISEGVSKKETPRRCHGRRQPCHALQDEGTRKLPYVDHTFVLLNPKDIDSHSKSLLQEALQVYMEVLPSMNYAANTGKASRFLERCLSSGKYSTLILCSNSLEGSRKVIAAVTFQIIPVDTQFAEIPLTAVTSDFQKKGIGSMIYGELKKRFRSIGISNVFCWADKDSESFWLKQGFITVGEVDGKGRARKLPVRADIRRTLCFPCDATLMVAHIEKDIVAFVDSSLHVDSNALIKATDHGDGVNITQFRKSKKDFSLTDLIKTEGVAESPCHADEIFFSSVQNGKRLVWEASLSSLKSKRIRGSHVPNDSASSEQNCERTHSQVERLVQRSADGRIDISCPRIMFMNIADDDKKSMLTKIVEELGGSVTSNGSSSTHLITGKARQTLNFCLSLCSGTWILSASWLKSSFREGKFLDESQHILEDKDYWLKYKCGIRDAITRAKATPHSLLRGYQVCLSKHIHASISDLSCIILCAGGNVIRSLEGVVEPSKTIFIACEEGMEEAFLAAKMGVRTFTSDWLMTCVMRQELDLEAYQFAEPLQ